MVIQGQMDLHRWGFGVEVSMMVKPCPPDCPCGEGGKTGVGLSLSFMCLHLQFVFT